MAANTISSPFLRNSRPQHSSATLGSANRQLQGTQPVWRHRTPVRPVVGAAVLVLTTEVFVHVFGEGNVLMSGVLLILVMLFMPEGLVGRCTIHGGSHSQAQFIANW